MSETKKSGLTTYGQPIPEMAKIVGKDAQKKGQPIPPPPRQTERQDTQGVSRDGNDNSGSGTRPQEN